MTDQFTAGPMPGFERGWAVMPFFGKVGHHWRKAPASKTPRGKPGDRYWLSECGRVAMTTTHTQPLQIGSFDVCARCAAAKGAGPTSAERG